MPTAAVNISQSLQRSLDSLIGFIPNLIGFLIILLIGYVIARVVKAVVATLLEKVAWIEPCPAATQGRMSSGPARERDPRASSRLSLSG
jgi:Conserved TM helix